MNIKILSAAMFLSFVPAVSSAASYDLTIDQRNANNTAWISRLVAVPTTGDGVFSFNNTTKLPQFLTYGSGFVVNGSVLNVTPVPGPQGVKGDQGIQGIQGIQGVKGDTGDVGPQGLQGLQGVPGVKGDTGLTGSQGIQGPTGLTGSKGDKGDKGDTGAPGAPGVQGDRGEQGLQGVQGVSGTAGVNSFSGPSSRTLNLGTAYQCTNVSKPCVITVTLSSTSTISVSGSSNNEGQITVGSTSGVATGTGSNMFTYRNLLGGTIVVGLTLTSSQANSYTVTLPAGWYFAVRQTSGTGLTVVSAFEQVVG